MVTGRRRREAECSPDVTEKRAFFMFHCLFISFFFRSFKTFPPFSSPPIFKGPCFSLDLLRSQQHELQQDNKTSTLPLERREVQFLSLSAEVAVTSVLHRFVFSEVLKTFSNLQFVCSLASRFVHDHPSAPQGSGSVEQYFHPQYSPKVQ